MTRMKPPLARLGVIDDSGRLVGHRIVNLADVRRGPRRHDSLPPDLHDRAVALFEQLRGRNPIVRTLADWIDGFLHDTNPDREILLWETIVRVADRLWSEGKLPRALLRVELVRAVVMVGSGYIDVPARVRHVTDELVARIRCMLDSDFQYAGIRNRPVSVDTAMEWEAAVRPADVVIAVHPNGAEALFYGRDALERISDSDIPEALHVARIPVGESHHASEFLLAIVQTVKGRHDYTEGKSG